MTVSPCDSTLSHGAAQTGASSLLIPGGAAFAGHDLRRGVQAHDVRGEIINRWQDHVHLEEPCLPVILAVSGHPGGDNADSILRAIGISDEMLNPAERAVDIDTTFDFRTDAIGRDPDSHSPTLRRNYKLLWSKPLPSGAMIELDDTTPGEYLHQ